VLVLHSWWGLNRGTKDLTERLAGRGFTAMAPDLFAGTDLKDPQSPMEAAERLARADVDATAGFILASIVALRAHSADPQAPVGILGFSMGASWALWAAGRQPDSVGAVVAYYGHQDMDFDDLSAPVLCHFAELDPLVSEDQATEMQARIGLAGGSVEVTTHPGTRHFFAESDVPVVSADGAVGERSLVEASAAETAWGQTIDFFSGHLEVPPPQ
jgi:carboxymethylenebutenolidase